MYKLLLIDISLTHLRVWYNVLFKIDAAEPAIPSVQLDRQRLGRIFGCVMLVMAYVASSTDEGYRGLVWSGKISLIFFSSKLTLRRHNLIQFIKLCATPSGDL